MTNFKHPVLKQLTDQQVRFAPPEWRLVQLARAERLMLEVDEGNFAGRGPPLVQHALGKAHETLRLGGRVVAAQKRRMSLNQVVCRFECIGSPWKIALVSRTGSPAWGTMTMASPHHGPKPLR